MNDPVKSRRQVWEEKIEQWKASGQTMKAWCKENNISYNTFQYWRQRLCLKDKRNSTSPSSFIELPDENPAKAGVELHINGVSLILAANFDEAVLIRCVRILRGL